MAVKNKYIDDIVIDYTESSKSRTWDDMKPSAQVSHDTGNLGSTASGNANWMKSETKGHSSAHTFSDDKEIRVVIPVDDPEKAWHVQYQKPKDNAIWGDDSNDIAFGHELCHGGSIDFESAYDRYVWMHVYCAKKFDISLDRIEGHFKLDPERRSDPMYAFNRNGKTWAGFKADVKMYYDQWEKETLYEVDKHDPNETHHVIVSGDTLWAIAIQHDTDVDTLKELNPGVDPQALQPGSKLQVKEVQEQPKPEPEPKTTGDFIGKRVESKVDDLNFYDSPRWDDPVGQMNKGIGFPNILAKAKVGGGYQYKVENSNGDVYYVTTSEIYVKLVDGKESIPEYVGMRVESKVASLNFYDSPRWDDPTGQVKNGWGFPNILAKIDVGDGEQYKVENSNGDVYYVTANPNYVRVVSK